MSDDQINIEINGVTLTAEKGEMLIQVADKAGIRIPRFCYHSKLSVAANCRMCLVEVEKAPKPLPACATPVMDGMKVFTKSPKAIAAQKATMEFLLINHPLDCPICDQGGECELQDVAMGYGGDLSRYTENKRVVRDKNLGSLIATDMTRCIHCTRCVRFGQELAGIRELGATGRGEDTRIGTYIEQAVNSEMSGNVIDLCPVGALTAKPSRFSARAWEIDQRPSIAAHDCIGSNTYVHTFRGEITRTVPHDHEAINECWLSDRDRFSYEGCNHESRLTAPMIKVNDEWQQTDWNTALEMTAKALGEAQAETHFLVSPNATLEEMVLMKQLASGLGSGNIDHRLRHQDFREIISSGQFPSLGLAIESLEQLDAALLIGSHVRKEQPIAAHRLRKAAMKGGKIMLVNQRDFDLHFHTEENIVISPHRFVNELAAIARSVFDQSGAAIPSHLQHIISNADSTDNHLAVAEHLRTAEHAAVIVGTQALAMPHLEEIRQLAAAIAEQTGAAFGYLTDGANAAGAYLAGILPGEQGRHAGAMLQQSSKAAVLLGIEPELDTANPVTAIETLKQTDFVVSLTAYATETMKSYANVLLPMTPATETSGTFINAEGRAQSFAGVAQAHGDSRPGWKVLRVLGNLLDFEGFEYNRSDEVRDQILESLGALKMDNSVASSEEIKAVPASDRMIRIGSVATYHEDAVVRRADSLQMTHDANDVNARINSKLAEAIGAMDQAKLVIRQGDATLSVDYQIDDGVPDRCVWLPTATEASCALDVLCSDVVVESGS